MWARLRASRGATATLAVLAACVTASVGLSVGHAAQSSTEALHSAPELQSGPGSAQRVSTRSAQDPDAQEAAARAVVDELFDGVEVLTATSLRTDPHAFTSVAQEVAQEVQDDGDRRVVLGSDPDLASVAELVEGRWPTAPAEASLSVAAATAGGLAVGDVVTVGDADLTVTGTWQPRSADAPTWVADELAVQGSDGATFGPLLTDPGTVRAADDAAFVRWTVVPVVGSLTPESLATIAQAAPQLKGAMTQAGVGVRGVTLSGGLGEAAERLAAQDSTVRSLTWVPVVLAGLAALVALAQVSRLVIRLRVRENQILVARGASVGQLSRSVAAEAAVISVAGVLTGGLVVATFWAVTGNTEAWTWSTVAPVALTGLLVVAVVCLFMIGSVALDARSLTRAAPLDSSGRGRSVLGFAAVLLLAAAAAFFLWRVWLVRAQASADFLIMLAPGVLLLCAVLLLLGLFRPVMSAAASFLGRRPGLDAVLVARQVARRLSTYAVPVVLVSTATAAAVFASSYSASTGALATSVDEVRDGASVRILTGDTGGVTLRSSTTAVQAQRTDGVEDATLALVAPGTVGTDAAQVIALPADWVPGVMSRGAGLAALSETSRTTPGVEVPEGAVQLRADLHARPLPTPDEDELRRMEAWVVPVGKVVVRGTLWLADDAGAVLRRDLTEVVVSGAGSTQDEASARSVVDLPEGSGTWRLVAVDLSSTTYSPRFDVEAAVTGLVAVAAEGPEQPLVLPDDQTWERVVATNDAAGGPEDGNEPWSAADGALLRGSLAALRQSSDRVRFMPQAQESQPVRAVVTQGVLDRIGLTVPAQTEVSVAGQKVPLQVVAAVPAVPGTLDDLAVLMDLDALHEAQLRGLRTPSVGTELWVGASQGTAEPTGLALVDELGGRAELITRADPAGAGAGFLATIFWLLTASTVLCALGGLWAALMTVTGARSGEVVALRSVGVSPRRQARLRTREAWAVLSFALPVGLLVGAVISWLVVGVLARTTVVVAPLGLAVPLAVDLVPLGMALGALLLGCFLLVQVQATQVRAQAADTTLREDLR